MHYKNTTNTSSTPELDTTHHHHHESLKIKDDYDTTINNDDDLEEIDLGNSSRADFASLRELSWSVQERQEKQHHTSKRVYVLRSMCLICAIVYRLIAQWWSQGTPALVDLIKNASMMISFCFLAQNVLYSVFPRCKEQHILAQYTIGCFHQMTFIVSYLIDERLFFLVWSPIFFGSNMWTITLLITRPNVFGPMAGFYAMKQIIVIFITGSWALVKCCSWESYIILGVMLWLSADIYANVLNAYHTTHPDMGRELFIRLRLMAFTLERIQKFSAYMQGLIVTGGDASMLGWIVLGSGFFIDMFISTFFQVRSIRKLLKQEQGGRNSSLHDIEEEREESQVDTEEEELA